MSRLAMRVRDADGQLRQRRVGIRGLGHRTDGGRTVILLHGFPNDRTAWDAVAPELAAQSFRVLAPNQRGYSPAARPRRRDYRLNPVADDVLALADQARAEEFDLVG